MGQKNTEQLEEMIEALAKRVAELERYVPNVEKRVTRLEENAKKPPTRPDAN